MTPGYLYAKIDVSHKVKTTMIIDMIEWAKSLKKGDLVGCTYGSLTTYIAKVEYVLTNCPIGSGFAVKLEGIDKTIDIYYIPPYIS